MTDLLRTAAATDTDTDTSSPMSTDAVLSPDTHSESLPSAALSVTQGAGQLLRQAREAQHQELPVLAHMLKVPVEKLQALEDEDWQRLPDLVFARALALGVCRHLHIPSQPIMDLLPQPPTKRLPNRTGINEPVRYRSVPSILPQAAGVLVRRLGLLAILLLGAMLTYGVWQWQQGRFAASEDDAAAALQGAASSEDGQPLFAPGQAPTEAPLEPEDTEPASASPSAAPAQAPSLALPTQGGALISTTLSAAPAALQATGTTTSTSTSTDPRAPAALEATPTTSPAATAPQAATGTAPALRLRATAQSWVQVRDGEGRLVMEKILRPDEVFETSARRPLSVVLGRADAIAVEVDGAAFDPQTKSRDNVARFEVK